jgi:putative phage-type endonuclease
MKKNLIRNDIPLYTDEWYNFRQNGVGGSEISTVMGLSNYKLAATLFLEKIGFKQNDFKGNKNTLAGRMLEDNIAKIWDYYDPATEDWVENMINEAPVRKHKRINGYIQSPDFPNCFVSLDRASNKGTRSALDGQVIDYEFPIELKSIMAMVVKRFKAGVPTDYIVQNQMQMMVTGCEYGEVFMWDTDRNAHLFPQQKSEVLWESINDEIQDFWSLVVKGRELMGDMSDARGSVAEQKVIDEIYNLAPIPKPEQEELRKDFLNERHVGDNEVENKDFEAPQEVYQSARDYEMYKALMSDLKNRQTRSANDLREFMGNNTWCKLEDGGKITYKESKSGNKTLLVKPKDVPEEEFVKATADLIDITY